MNWFLILKGAATVGIPTALLWYSIRRMRGIAGPQTELEAQSLVSIVRAFPATEFSLQSLETLVRRADFRSPETRRAELKKLQSWLSDHPVLEGDGFSLVFDQPSARPGPEAEHLASAHIRCLESFSKAKKAPGAGEDEEDTRWCIVGMTAAMAQSSAEAVPGGDGAAAAREAFLALSAAANGAVAMNAFYLYYAPAPHQRLSRSEALRLTQDLKTLR